MFSDLTIISFSFIQIQYFNFTSQEYTSLNLKKEDWLYLQFRNKPCLAKDLEIGLFIIPLNEILFLIKYINAKNCKIVTKLLYKKQFLIKKYIF